MRKSLGKISGFKRIPIKWRLTLTRPGYKYHTKRPNKSSLDSPDHLSFRRNLQGTALLWNRVLLGAAKLNMLASWRLQFWDDFDLCIYYCRKSQRLYSIMAQRGIFPVSIHSAPPPSCLISQTDITSCFLTSFWLEEEVTFVL